MEATVLVHLGFCSDKIDEIAQVSLDCTSVIEGCFALSPVSPILPSVLSQFTVRPDGEA